MKREWVYNKLELQIQTLLIRIRILTAWSWSGSLQLQRGTGNVPKTVLFIHLNLIFLVTRSNRTQPKGIRYFVRFSPLVNFVVLIRVAYGSGSWKIIWILTDPNPQHWNKQRRKCKYRRKKEIMNTEIGQKKCYERKDSWQKCVRISALFKPMMYRSLRWN
jgi:hypothetical protein